MDRYETERTAVDQPTPQGHYGGLKREHRKAIDDASKLLLSDSWRNREDALRVLMRIHDNPRSCNYHKVRICSILADRACEDLVDIKPWAIKCIDSCRHIIIQEGLSIGSSSREAFEDMIDSAQAVLKKVREDEAKEGQRRREILAEELSERDFATYQNYELKREGFDVDDDDEGDDDMEVDEEYRTEEEDDDDGEGGDSMDEGSTYDSADDIERALCEELDEFERKNEDVTALESRITRDPNYKEVSEIERTWEVEVSESEGALIGQFVYMLKMNRQGTESALRRVATTASYEVSGIEFESEPQAQVQESQPSTQTQTQTQAQAQPQPPQLQLPPVPTLNFSNLSIRVKPDDDPAQPVQDNASGEPDATL